MQVVLVIVFVSAAVAYLAWQGYKRFFKKDGGCGGCAMNKGELE